MKVWIIVVIVDGLELLVSEATDYFCLYLIAEMDHVCKKRGGHATMSPDRVFCTQLILSDQFQLDITCDPS